MITKVILNIILNDGEKYLVVKRSETESLNPGAWEFPGGHLEVGQTIEETLKRELKEELAFNDSFEAKLVNYKDDIRLEDGIRSHNLELFFLIPVDSKNLKIELSSEHSSFEWVTKDFQEINISEIVD